MRGRMTRTARGLARTAGTAVAIACALCLSTAAAAAGNDNDAAPRAINALDEAAALGRASALLDGWAGDRADLEAARLELDAVLAANPESVPAYVAYARYYLSSSYVRGTSHEQRGLTAAERALDRAIALSPDYIEAYVQRARVYILQDRDDEAEAALRRAEALGAQDDWLDLYWADLLHARGKDEEALAKCEGARARASAGSDAMRPINSCLIQSYAALGRYEEADATYRAQIALIPDRAWLRGNYAAFLLCTRHRPEAAVESATQALQLMDYGMARITLAAALYQIWSMRALAGQADAAEETWARAWSTAPGDPAALMETICSRQEALPILRAMRDTGRAEPLPPLPAILAAADADPDGVIGIFGFEVAATGRKNGEVYLNSEADYRDQLNLTIRFSPESAAAFRKRHGEDPDVAFKGKRIAVVGEARRVKIYFFANGQPTEKFYYQTHVAITEPWQVTAVEPAGPLPPPVPVPVPVPTPGLEV